MYRKRPRFLSFKMEFQISLRGLEFPNLRTRCQNDKKIYQKENIPKRKKYSEDAKRLKGKALIQNETLGIKRSTFKGIQRVLTCL